MEEIEAKAQATAPPELLQASREKAEKAGVATGGTAKIESEYLRVVARKLG